MPDAGWEAADRAVRIGSVVGAVVAQAVRDAGASGIVLIDDGSPEARLAHRWCADALGTEAVVAVAPPDRDAPLDWARERGLATAPDPDEAESSADATVWMEAHRFVARLTAGRRGALVAHPANKTALLLGAPPPERLLPLGDLYAAQVRTLAGDWTAPAVVRRLARRAGGIDALDRALARFVDERRPAGDALAELPDDVADDLSRAFEAGRFARRRLGLVPKLAARTAGVDLFA